MADELPDHLLAGLSEFLAARMGLHFPCERWPDLKRNIKPAAASFGFDDINECVRWLLSSTQTRAQIDTLASHLTVGETYFFREQQVFEILQDIILPGIIRQRSAGDRRLRIWSAGCSSGEEPYSIAILVEKLIPDWKRWNIHILGTDINPCVLRKASEGIYSEWSFRNAPSWLKATCFQNSARGQYEIMPRFKRMVTFAHLNLAEDIYPSLLNNTNAMDLILCRNVLMYFSPEQAIAVIAHFHNALVQNGWLNVSATETSPVLYRGFKAVTFQGFTLYQKTEKAAETAPHSSREQAIAMVSDPAAAASPMTEEFRPSAEPVDPTQVVASQSKQPDSEFDRALQLYEAGRYQEAVENLLPFVSAQPTSDPRHAALLARAYANEGKLPLALLWCDKALQANKVDPELHHLRAVILQEQGQFEDSALALKRALYLDPDFVLPHVALGNLALRSENFALADKHFRNALSLLNRYPPDQVLRSSDGITAGRLHEIIRATIAQETTA